MVCDAKGNVFVPGEMKIIISRKGCDSRAGGIPSPILEDRTLLSLPIPHKAGSAQYAELTPFGHNLGRIVADLDRRGTLTGKMAHVDPDLNQHAKTRLPDWRPIFGQSGAAQAHLERQGVGAEDIFLFFGVFREVRQSGERYRYVVGAPLRHVFFGWMRIGQVVRLYRGDRFSAAWAADHPHIFHNLGKRNTIYIAADGAKDSPYDAGAFRKLRQELVLTEVGKTSSNWQLPSWFSRRGTSPTLTYHRDPERWSRTGDFVRLKTVGQGQEFVLDTRDYPEAEDWALSLIQNGER